MNYRRGLQRLYLVLAVAWVAGVLFVVPSGRWEPWHKKVDPKVWADLGVVPATPEEVSFSDLKSIRDYRIEVWLWATGLAFIPPLIGYAFLFLVAPWVYRGFHPAIPK